MQFVRIQLKNEFGKGTWTRGVGYDREGRVKDLIFEQVGEGESPQLRYQAKVLGSESTPYETNILVDKGHIKKSGCSCPAHGIYDTHCKHVAALTHHVIKKATGGAASPIEGGEGGQPNGQQRHPNQKNRHPNQKNNRNNRNQKNNRQQHPKRSNEPLKAVAIAYVKAVFEGDKQVGITIEPGLRYTNERAQEKTIVTANCKQDNGFWLTQDRKRLQVTQEKVPILGNLFSSKTVYTGSMSVHMMSNLMSSSQAAYIVFDDSLKLDVSLSPLKISKAFLGPKQAGRYRELSFELKNEQISLSVEDLKTMAGEARVSGNFAWIGSKLYTFERSLDWIESRANIDGQIYNARGQNPVMPSDLFPVVWDEETKPLHPIAAYRLALELGAQEFVVDDDWKEYHEWLKNFERTTIPSLPRVTYGFELREYQTNGLQWLWSLYHRGLSALLADDMGLGKTHQVLALLSSIYKSKVYRPEEPTLVVAPTSVVAAWAQKLTKYKTGLKWSVFHGKERKIPTTGNDLILTTYGILQRDDALLKQKWHMVILDEAQAIKNPTTVSAKQARALQSKFRIIMTGTPIENSMTDLWSLMEFLLPGYLGGMDRFKRLYIPREGMPSVDQAITVKRLASPFLLRRTKSQVLQELPEKIEEVRSCELTEDQRVRYNQFLNTKEVEALRAGLRGSGKIDYVGILSVLTRLKQVCDHPELPELTAGTAVLEKIDFHKTGKWEAYEEIMEEALGSGLKVVVFTQYLSMMDLMARRLSELGVDYAQIRGETTNRGAQLDRFANDPNCRVFICSLLAGGMGIDLTAGSVCIHYDRWWNPAKENQATDRLHRIGQTRGVQVFKLQIPGTIEERIASIIESKSALADALIEESTVGLKTFSRKELLDLLTEIPKEEDKPLASSNSSVE